ALAASRRLVADALALWAGDPLDGLPGPFARGQRARLAEWRLVASQTRFELDLALGRHEDAVPELAALAAAHPLREGFQRLLMLALHRSGRRAEAIEVFERSRSLLDAELGLDPSPGLVELRRAIAAGRPTVSAGPSAMSAERPAAPTGHPAVPTGHPAGSAGRSAGSAGRSAGSARRSAGSAAAQLPTDLIDFTGRDEQVARLVRALSAGPAHAVVGGPVGVGKSALAVHVAHLVRDAYPDGQLYADLRRDDPDTLLLDFLRTLGAEAGGVPDRAERAERSALLRSALRGRRMLIVLDNARDPGAVHALLPGGDCSVLVTCGGRPPCVPDAVELAEFSAREAEALFARVAGPDRAAREPDAVAEAVALCGRLPLAVRIAAARLASRPGWTARSLVRRLADERRRLAELKVGTLDAEAVFARECDRLGAEQGRACQVLARSGPASFSVEEAAAVLDRPRAETEAALAALTASGLLASPSPDLFRYPDLLRLYARGLPW
ncbi:AfsR family transcriptional regulator, partial [Actinomadura logoneensis]